MRGSVCGYVVQADNEAPIANATINVVRGPGPVPTSIIVTNRSGWFALDDLPSGRWVLSATISAGHGQATVYVFDNVLSDVTIEVARLPRGARRPTSAGAKNKKERNMLGSVRGRVVHADNGKPLEDATIIVVRGAGPAPDISPVTNGAGLFMLDELPEGEWLLRAFSPNGETGETTVHVSAGLVADTVIKVTSTHSHPDSPHRV